MLIEPKQASGNANDPYGSQMLCYARIEKGNAWKICGHKMSDYVPFAGRMQCPKCGVKGSIRSPKHVEEEPRYILANPAE